MRRLGTLLVFGFAGAAGSCVGPISDWPTKSSDEGAESAPVIPGAGGSQGPAPAVTPPDAGVSVPGTFGGSTAGTVGSGGGTLGGNSSSAQDASAPSSAVDGGVPADLDAAAAPGDGGSADASTSDGSCTSPPDAGVSSCAGFGCGTTLSSLTALSRDGGTCVTPEALPLACDGELSRAAEQCTQENALSLGLGGRPVTMCMRRLPKLAHVSGDCLQCYADETLCTLSRCFVACIDGSDPTCQQCRSRECAQPFSQCSGLPSSH